ncbi:MAG: Yip1 family protein [Candidatus Aminicenantes bacterium]
MDIVARTQGILLKPKEEWDKIKGESLSVSQMFTSYAAILALIPPVCQFIGLSLIGRSIPIRGLTRYGFGRSLLYAIFLYLLSLVSVYVLGLIINALAPTFSSKQNQENAMKIAVFSMTPVWVAGVFYLIPFLGWLAVLGSLYGIYLIYLGFNSTMMDTPADKVVGYVVISIIVAVIIMVVVWAVLGAIFLVGAVGRIY